MKRYILGVLLFILLSSSSLFALDYVLAKDIQGHWRIEKPITIKMDASGQSKAIEDLYITDTELVSEMKKVGQNRGAVFIVKYYTIGSTEPNVLTLIRYTNDFGFELKTKTKIVFDMPKKNRYKSKAISTTIDGAPVSATDINKEIHIYKYIGEVDSVYLAKLKERYAEQLKSNETK